MCVTYSLQLSKSKKSIIHIAEMAGRICVFYTTVVVRTRIAQVERALCMLHFHGAL